MASRAGPVINAPPPMHRCDQCNAIFESEKRLFSHQEEAGHLACEFCDKLFHTMDAVLDHLSAEHRESQDIVCPGCEKNFFTAGAWVNHVESNECSGVFPSDFAGDTAEIMDYLSTRLLKSTEVVKQEVELSGPSHITDTWGEDWEDQNKFDVERHPENFPRTVNQEFYQGSSKQPNFLTGSGAGSLEQRPGNAWAQKKDLFPESKASRAVPPPRSMIENFREPSQSAKPTGERILDPDHPDFNVALFMNPILETYKCPYKSCSSKFKYPKGLINHLRSPAHSGNEFRCPGCRVVFTSAASWAQHAETVNTSRCRVAQTEVYGLALNAITNGALEVELHEDIIGNKAKVRIVKGWPASRQLRKHDPASKPVPGSEGWAKAKQVEASERKLKFEPKQETFHGSW
ncbi:uncharacterized protein F4822DRAFT_427249 [Hypoxylon trugodes]|uniref:uncharacterized protein n=1 Tax=Hypoxylon trugodes TaxID=326681 RepID=UPI002190ABA8|nr:uncharacterized protein F4822DRAFT_427249 [Hypoxylon trugodes]KAI1391400.1 hypothetical protein F4822DRAFT_427249 [Hypoxylon trugodes]